jgi:hypothetical protein
MAHRFPTLQFAFRIPQFLCLSNHELPFTSRPFGPFLRANPRYGGDNNHGADSSGGCFLLHRRHLASAERATEHISFRVTVTVSIGCAFTDTDSADAP